MGVKRKIEESEHELEKKTKSDQSFPIDTFIKRLKDPETSFLVLSEFNEHVRHLSSKEAVDQFLDDIIPNIKSNLNHLLALITEEKRKSSENITLCRFLTTLMDHQSRTNDLTVSETIIKKFASIAGSMQNIYFMLSIHNTASHLKITLRFLLTMMQQNEFCARMIFSLVDFKRPCWKPLLKRRDIRDPEDVRFWTIKFFLSPLIYQNVDTTQNLIKEQDVLHEIFNGLVNDARSTVEYVLDEMRTNVIMMPGITKTNKVHLFDDRNLKSLIRLYNWAGQQRQKDAIKAKKKTSHLDESVDLEEMETEDNAERDEVRRLIHTFMMIILNSKNYGINFFDPNFGTTSKNSNPIILKVITNLSHYFLTDEYIANLIITCLATCPDLLQPYFKLIMHEYLNVRSKNLSGTLEFLCDVIQQQKPLDTWRELFYSINDSNKLADILINLTLPLEIMTKFDQIIMKNSDTRVQFVSMKFLSLILERVKEAFNMIVNGPLACERAATIEVYQQAILRYIPKPDHFCDALNILKGIKSSPDFNQGISQYINLLKLYSSSCFMTMSAMNITLDILLSNSIINLLSFFKDSSLDSQIIDNYFQCIKNILYYRESIDDATWARHNKELECTPIRMLLKLGKQQSSIDQTSEDLTEIICKFSSMLNSFRRELVVWIYTWLKLGKDEKLEQFLSGCIEKVILNPYPLVERTAQQSEYSLMIYSALDSIEHSKEDISNDIDEYLCHVLFQINIGLINPPSNNVHQHLRSIYLKERTNLNIYRLLDIISSADKQNQVLVNEMNKIEKTMLANIDSVHGPDKVQINLAMELNLFKIFALHDHGNARLIPEMLQCLNIVLLLHDSRRSFEMLFDRTIEHLEFYSSSIDEEQIISFLCRIINGLDMSQQTKQTIQHSKMLLKCLEYEPNNYRLIYFAANYLSSEHRTEFLNIISRTFTDNVDILNIIIDEIQNNRDVHHEQYLDTIIDGLKILNDNIAIGVECIMELIDRMRRASNQNWKNILRLKQKFLFKLVTSEYASPQTRILVAKLIVRTIQALRPADRPHGIERLINKSDRSLLLLAHVFHDLINANEPIENEMFHDYLRKLIDNHSSESVVYELLRVYCLNKVDQSDRLLQLLQSEDEPEALPVKQTHKLLLMIKLFPESISNAETIYTNVVEQARVFFQSHAGNDDDVRIDQWLISFEQCTNHLSAQANYQVDLYDLINRLLKHFAVLTLNSIRLLKSLVNFFVSRESFDQKRLSKLFANFLKHGNFFEQLSSSNRSILVDILSLFVTHYDANQSSITIDCSKHFPMLLSIYNPTLSKNDQHTLACMYKYEKRGHSMKSAFVWGEAALKFYSTATDAKSILLQASKLEQVMSLLNEKMMLKSILHYPTTRRLRKIEPRVYEEGDQIYDPAYLIPVFYHSLGSECVVKCQHFVEKHCLAYCIMALSTRCGLLRAVVYNCLARFEQHLLSQRFYCKEQISTMLTLLKQSVKKINLKLAPIVALFLAKLVDLFTHPESKMYRTITRFLLKQPYIDLVHIPLFSDLFHSSSVEYKYERGWVLNLLKNGIKDPVDYSFCAKEFVFKTLMTFYNCSLCDDSTKLEILSVFHATSKISAAILPLVFDYGFLVWLQVVVKDCSSESLATLTLTIQNISVRLLSIDNQVPLLEFDSLLVLLLRRLQVEATILPSVADNVISTLVKYRECSKTPKHSFDIKQVRHVADCSTMMKSASLLSCFC